MKEVLSTSNLLVGLGIAAVIAAVAWVLSSDSEDEKIESAEQD